MDRRRDCGRRACELRPAGYAVAATLPPGDPLPEPVAGFAVVSALDDPDDDPESEPFDEPVDEADDAVDAAVLPLLSERLSVR